LEGLVLGEVRIPVVMSVEISVSDDIGLLEYYYSIIRKII